MFPRFSTPILEPKYWKEETKEVELDDVELTKRPTTLDSILGTYRWFYFNFTNRDGDIEPDSGYITLENMFKSKATPAKISGSIQVHVHHGTFQGLKKAKEKAIVGTRQKYRKNFWEIKEMKWEGRSEEDMDPKGNGFGVCEVKDDNGNPFLKFESGDKEECVCHGGPEWAFYVGKKVSTPSGGHESDQGCELTDDEKVRLGMLLSEPEVEELATKGYISDGDSDEDSLEFSEADHANAEKTGLKRRLSIDEKEGISSSEAKKKVRKE